MGTSPATPRKGDGISVEAFEASKASSEARWAPAELPSSTTLPGSPPAFPDAKWGKKTWEIVEKGKKTAEQY